MQKNVCYHTAIYLRLSREDGDMNCGAKRESDSISSQRALACSFVREQPDMELFDLYIDDGYSGANPLRVRLNYITTRYLSQTTSKKSFQNS